MIYARVDNGIVVEIFDLPEGLSITDCFAPELASAFLEAPDGTQPNWTYDGTVFEAPIEPMVSLDDLKAGRIAVLTAACSSAIIGGYSSAALGSAHTYPSGVTDQINMMGSVTASLFPDLTEGWQTPFWCADSTGVWDFRMHDVAQIQQAGSDGKAHVVDCQAKLMDLAARVMAATTEASVEAVAWSSESLP